MPRKRQRGPQAPYSSKKLHTRYVIFFQKQAGEKPECYNPSESGAAVHIRGDLFLSRQPR